MQKNKIVQNRKSSSLWVIPLFLILAAGFTWAVFLRKKNDPPRETISENKTETAPAMVQKPEMFPRPAMQIKLNDRAILELLDAESPKIWTDVYQPVPLQIDALTEGVLLAVGAVPLGVKPENIEEPSVLHPVLLVASKKEKSYQKITSFDFRFSESSISGLASDALKGIPRIRSDAIEDFDQDGSPEIVVTFDTKEDWAQGFAVLFWKQGEFHWAKVKLDDQSEKIALWKIGSGDNVAYKVEWKKNPSNDSFEFVYNAGELDPKHPEQGFVWQQTVFKFESGLFVKISR